MFEGFLGLKGFPLDPCEIEPDLISPLRPEEVAAGRYLPHLASHAPAHARRRHTHTYKARLRAHAHTRAPTWLDVTKAQAPTS